MVFSPEDVRWKVVCTALLPQLFGFARASDNATIYEVTTEVTTEEDPILGDEGEGAEEISIYVFCALISAAALAGIVKRFHFDHTRRSKFAEVSISAQGMTQDDGTGEMFYEPATVEDHVEEGLKLTDVMVEDSESQKRLETVHESLAMRDTLGPTANPETPVTNPLVDPKLADSPPGSKRKFSLGAMADSLEQGEGAFQIIETSDISGLHPDSGGLQSAAESAFADPIGIDSNQLVAETSFPSRHNTMDMGNNTAAEAAFADIAFADMPVKPNQLMSRTSLAPDDGLIQHRRFSLGQVADDLEPEDVTGHRIRGGSSDEYDSAESEIAESEASYRPT
ncbi:hypothetical protein CYMTET_22689 [Cymbomonas tetramitiformis]|uniref:Uncharacterized protein n=1 Tax=Cymbomonas tetramitiformis TaxID=36881 RepID=A0AAE0FZZ1_9CHLO|nr:hypothetical protein CYMTET_22689 [Cymbomonas tetramitiformis]